MADRGGARGGSGRGRGSGGQQRGGYGGQRGGNRGGYSGGRGGGASKPYQQQKFQRQDSRAPKESILDLSKYTDQRIRVKFSGGREGMLCYCYYIF